jgi:hypothetical protein
MTGKTRSTPVNTCSWSSSSTIETLTVDPFSDYSRALRLAMVAQIATEMILTLSCRHPT